MPLSTTSQRVAANVRAEIARSNRSGANVASALGRSQHWISRRLAGQVAFDTDELAAIAGELGVPLSALIGEAQEASA